MTWLRNGFAAIGMVAAGAVAVCRFPVREAQTQETVLGTTYTVNWRGDTVMNISPGGIRVPLYQRKHTTGTPIAMIRREVPEITFHL